MATRKKATKKKAARKAAPSVIKLYAPLSTPAIGVGNKIYPVDANGRVTINASQEKNFLKMGCTKTKPKAP